ncbi:uncharacterized protein LOC142223424 [Haematobia irritans]|uniref:uncharacterized protein LOC142223424 n=1 Tax=Haematobia irritans TaxID=7368 RepID=UPI003F4FF400
MDNAVEILSNILLPPCFCYFCKFQIGAGMDLRQHYEEYHRKEFLECNSKESANNNYHEEVNYELSPGGIGDNISLDKTKLKNRRTKFQAHEKPHQCHICNKSFTQRSSCIRHVRELHEQPQRLACDHCELRFNNQFNLRNHLKKAHGVIFEAFKCPHCPRVYNKQISLSKHMLSAHKDINQESTEMANGMSVPIENDPHILAENVLEELKQLQAAIAVTHNDGCEVDDNTHNETKNTSIDDAIVDEITIKDRLNPYGKVEIYKVQRIKRAEGFYYICEYCSKEFRKKSGYIRHRRTHTKIRPYICVMCKKSFPTQNELKRHCSTHILSEEQKYYKCPKCFEGFSTITGFDRHISLHSPEFYISFNCKECPKVFHSLKMYLSHSHADYELTMLKTLLPPPICMLQGEEKEYIDNKEKSNGSFKCSICGLEQHSQQALIQHEKRHKNLLKHQCSVCKRFYASLCTLRVHTRIHNNNRKYKCRQCNKKFQTKYDLKRHDLIHKQSIKNFKCRYCDQQFKTVSYCRSHMMTHLKQLIKTSVNGANDTSQHRKITLQTVIQNNNNMGIIVNDMNITKKPKIQRPPKTQEQIVCLKCGQQFRFNAWLKKHMAESHSQEKPFKCDICMKSFRIMKTLKQHILIHQDGGLPKPTCQVCGKPYANQRSLKIHLRLHTDEKPFKCEMDPSCMQTFRTSGHLASHQKSKHRHLKT